MYRYDEFDRQFVNERVAQFRDQAKRRLTGELTEPEREELEALVELSERLSLVRAEALQLLGREPR